MRIYDIIEKKKDGRRLEKAEIEFFISEYIEGKVADYQASALLMAICINGMKDTETHDLTMSMLGSGERIDLSDISGIKVDKHSSGGVGDKTSLVVLPIVSACGVVVPKMSGKGLGYTGGTIDKLESIPGIKTSLAREDFLSILKDVGFSITTQSGNLVPADKKLYALRDVTATVESIPLVASSIMSKKLALGSDCILLDVKSGSGAFMKDFESSVGLAETMVNIGNLSGKETIAVITNMDTPLGNAIGNSVEVIEACEVLKGRGPDDLRKVSIYLAANMLYLAGKGSISKCKGMALNVIKSGEAFLKLEEMVKRQKGDISALRNYDVFPKSKFSKSIFSDKSGYINKLDARGCGVSSVILGAGREQKDSIIDFSAGIVFSKKIGDFVKEGEVIAEIYSNSEEKLNFGEQKLKESIKIGDIRYPTLPLIQARVTKEGIERFI